MTISEWRFLVITLIVTLVASSCGPLAVDPSSGQGAPVPRWLTFQVRQVTVLADRGDGGDGKAEFQIYMIATDGTTAAKLAYPAEGTIPVSTGQSIQLGKYALSADEQSIGDELVVYIVAVDIDEQSPGAKLATDFVLELLTSAVMVAVTEGSSLAIELLAGQLVGQASGQLADWVRAADVIGQDTIVLKRSAGWNEGPAATYRTADNGIEIVYQVYLGEKLPAGLAWHPPTPTDIATPTEKGDQALLCESYYQSAVAAFEAGQWDAAAEAIIQLNSLDFGYKDIPDLVASRPELRQALAVRYGDRWLTGVVIENRVLTGHEHYGVNSVAFSPEGSLLASGSDDSTVYLWRVSDGRLLHTLGGHVYGVSSVAFSPDGATLASASSEWVVRLWRVSDGRLLHKLEGHAYRVNSVAFSPDGATLASGAVDDNVRLWRVSDGTPLRTLKEHTGDVNSVAFSSDGAALASASRDEVWLWRNGRVIRTLEGHTDSVWSVAFSPDGVILASGSRDNTVRLWRVSDGRLLDTLEGHSGAVNSVAFIPDGSLLASASGDSIVRLWRVSDGRLLDTLKGHTSAVNSVAFSPDGVILASGSDDDTVRLWTVQ